ncbi:MAG: hypothetical protein QXT64_01335 [Desulfurococcaceae archaeon]
MMIAKVKLKSVIKNETRLAPGEIEEEIRRLLTTGSSRRVLRARPPRRRKLDGLAVTAVAWSTLSGKREPVYSVAEVDDEEVEGFTLYAADTALKLTPLIKLPREVRVSILGRIEAVVEVEPCRIVEVVRRLWESAAGSEDEKLVAVYVEMRKAGLPLPVKTIGRLVGASHDGVGRAVEAITRLKLFAVKPEPGTMEKALVELGVPEGVAREVASHAEKQEYWTLHKMAGCLRAHGTPYNTITEMIGVSAPTARKLHRSLKRERGEYSALEGEEVQATRAN